ncbi:hypothetical protein [Flaviflexus huanghaiensis]|uniref:hypothetical protein n=1 Tax=Flaviflexus huanghaiensis TaxID=1111473 RepID=UPI0015FA4C52|nr:hypothetical protein [Flaviflexus huanghaiensis]
MEVVSVHTPGSDLAALEIRADFSMVERRPQTIGAGLSLAVASAGTEVLFTDRVTREAEAAVVVKDDSHLIDLVGMSFAVGTARFDGVEIDELGLWALPTQQGVVQAGDVLRPIPHRIEDSQGPFPRVPDGLPDAPENVEKRFSPPYEERAERLWQAIVDLGCRPSLEWAGSEDGEAIVGRGADDRVRIVIDLEDQAQQQAIDELYSRGALSEWLSETLKNDPLDM